jgi:hypothetical protein
MNTFKVGDRVYHHNWNNYGTVYARDGYTYTVLYETPNADYPLLQEGQAGSCMSLAMTQHEPPKSGRLMV